MNRSYLNGPSVGNAMTAEEFAQAAGRLPDRSFAQRADDGLETCRDCEPFCCGCDCGGTTPDCLDNGRCQSDGCCQQMICCCHAVSCPAHRPPEVDEGCCCKQSFHAALDLLCDERISSLLDFEKAAFITNGYVAGADLHCGKRSGHGPCAQAEVEAEGRHRPPCPSCSSGASDNLGELSGSFRRFSPCDRDLLDIDAELHTAGRKDCEFTATQVSLCELDAVVLQGARACGEGEMTSDEMTARNFRCLRQRLSQRLSPCGSCGQDQCACSCDERDCCCAAGLLGTLARNNLSRRVSLAAGLLVLQDVTLLGTVGSVLVLANDDDQRLYFVCVNSVQFIG